MNPLRTFAPLYLTFIFLLLNIGCENQAQPASSSEAMFQSAHHDFNVTTVIDGLQHPWSIAFLPGNEMLISERGRGGNSGSPARLRLVRDGELLPDPVPGLPEIRVGGQAGLLDIALHPDFEQNRLVYMSYAISNDDESEGTTAVTRAVFENDELTNVEEIFRAEAWSSAGGHYGSRLAFDQDNYLFVTVGDRTAAPGGDSEAQWSHPAQDLGTHFGKTIRLHDDGSVPSDNPFADQENALPEIWSYGHRNSQGMAVDADNNVWQNEHGPQGGDELNLVRPGINYGWPVIGYGVNYGVGEPLHHTVSEDGLERPVHHWLPSIAPSGMMVYTGDQFPEWQGNIFSGGLSGQHQVLSRVTVDGANLLSEELLLADEMRIRDVRQGPDGYIYIAVDHGGGDLTPIVRLEPAR